MSIQKKVRTGAVIASIALGVFVVYVSLGAQAQSSGRVLFRLQLVNPRRRSRDDVGDAVAPLGQTIVIQIRQRFGHEARLVEQLPEAIREAGEVMTRQRRSHPGVDADEEHTDAGTNPIAKRGQRASLTCRQASSL